MEVVLGGRYLVNTAILRCLGKEVSTLRLKKQVNRLMHKVVRSEKGRMGGMTGISNPPMTTHMEKMSKMSKMSISQVWDTPSTVPEVTHVKPSEGSGDISERRGRLRYTLALPSSRRCGKQERGKGG